MLQIRLSTNSSENGNQMDKMPFVKEEAVELCRICETVDNLLDISTEEFSHLYEKLHKIADFEGDYSIWLKFICISCGTKLENAFDFKIQCEDTFKKLVTQMENNVVDPFFGNPFSEDCPQNMQNINQEEQQSKVFFDIYEQQDQMANRDDDMGNPYEHTQINHQQYYNQNFMEKRKDFTNSAFSGGNSMKVHQAALGNAEKPKNSFSCAMCSEVFREKWKMREHMQRVHMVRKRNVCGICGTKPCDCTGRNAHKLIDKPFKCNICGRGFRTKSYMELHEKEHGVSSKLRSLLNQGTSNAYGHMDSYGMAQQQNEGNVEKIYKCQYCDKAFHRRQGLRMHYQIHTDERPYPCTYCEKRFRCRSHLNRHIYTHTGEKKYNCLVCHKSFTQSGSLRIHMRIHTGELPYECQNCLMRFRVRKTLLNHISRCPPINHEIYK